MTTPIHEKVRACRTAKYPQLIAKVHSGWLVMGDVQFLHGYCLILPDPIVDDLNALSLERRAVFSSEMAIVGDALMASTDAVRINYEILGNLAPALHGHIFPRYANEPEELKTKPVWFYDWDNARPFGLEKDKALMQKIREYISTAGIVANN